MSKKKPSNKKAARMKIRQMDVNGDAEADFGEFVVWLNKQDNLKHFAKNKALCQKVFNMMDENGNGKLDLWEIEKFEERFGQSMPAAFEDAQKCKKCEKHLKQVG